MNVPLEEFWRAIKLDLFGTFLGCRFGIPEIIKAGGGSVINLASNVALMGFPGRDAYTAAKGGVASITRSLAVSYAPQKVRVNAIAPSLAEHPFLNRVISDEDLALLRNRELFHRGAEVWEIAAVVAFLASDYSSYLSGEIISVSSQHP